MVFQTYFLPLILRSCALCSLINRFFLIAVFFYFCCFLCDKVFGILQFTSSSGKAFGLGAKIFIYPKQSGTTSVLRYFCDFELAKMEEDWHLIVLNFGLLLSLIWLESSFQNCIPGVWYMVILSITVIWPLAQVWRRKPLFSRIH